MWGLNKILPVLLAAKSNIQTYEPKSSNQLVKDMRSFYETLGINNDKCVYKEASPTVKFYYVTPPPPPLPSTHDAENNNNNNKLSWMDDNVISQDIHLMEQQQEQQSDIIQAVANKYGTDKPIAIYMPGLDGSGISAATHQFDDLSQTFELWRMSIGLQDRSSFVDLLKYTMDFVDELSSTSSNGRPIYLIGESFSGLLAPGVALQYQNRQRRMKQQQQRGEDMKTKNPISGLVMINPATSFDRSIWDVAAPLLVTIDRVTNNGNNKGDNGRLPFRLPTPYSFLGGLTLASMIPSSKQVDSIVETMLNIPPPGTNPTDILQTIEGYRDMMDLVAERLPSDMLDHRIKRWLMVGHDLINHQLHKLAVPTLIVVGKEDKLLSSGKEINRLDNVLPNSQKLVVNEAGHFVLDQNVNLTEAMIYSDILDPLDRKNKKQLRYDPIMDWKLPSHEVIKESIENVAKPLQDAHSPIFLSTDEHGNRKMGIDNVPREGPLVFVANHQLLGLDLNLIVPKLLEENITVRGLAHPLLFQNGVNDELEGRQPGLTADTTSQQGPNNAALFRRFGAVQVTPRNYYRLMESGQNALLFPGGVREVFHGRDEAYQLFWPEKVDFVRTASRFNATIVPVSAVGMADSVNMLLEPSQVTELPFIGERAKAFAANVTAARFDTDNQDENFLPPIVAPSLPARNYFVFGKAVNTNNLDPKDKDACQKVYLELQKEIEKGFEDVLEARENDPFNDTPRRLAYERITGRQAPTFNLKLVNK